MNEVKFPKFKDYTDQVVHYLQPKLDGHLTKIYKNSEGTYTILTKNDKDIAKKLLAIDHIREELSGLPNESIVFAERHSPGIFASSIPTLLNDADERLQLTIFAAPKMNGKDMSDVGLKSIMNILSELGVKTSETSDILPGKLSKKRKEELLQIAIKNKWEGWVLKEGHMKGWYKLKPVKTIDGFVTKTFRSTSDSFPNGLKGIRVGIWNKDGTIHDLGTTGNGFKKPYRMQFMSQEQIDAAREKYLQDREVVCVKIMDMFKLPRLNMDSLLNKVCEIAYDSVTAGEKLRFPRFIRWRDDKNLRDCTIEQLGG